MKIINNKRNNQALAGVWLAKYQKMKKISSRKEKYQCILAKKEREENKHHQSRKWRKISLKAYQAEEEKANENINENK